MRAATVSLALLVLLGACTDLEKPTEPLPGPDQPVPAKGSVTGRILSKEFGVMSGIRVEADPGDQAATSDARGVWTLNGLSPGLVALQLANLPPECAAPEPRPVELNPGATVRVRFLVDCSGTGEAGPAK